MAKYKLVMRQISYHSTAPFSVPTVPLEIFHAGGVTVRSGADTGGRDNEERDLPIKKPTTFLPTQTINQHIWVPTFIERPLKIVCL